jgi:TM2 domain-containing membrane protein YozV
MDTPQDPTLDPQPSAPVSSDTIPGWTPPYAPPAIAAPAQATKFCFACGASIDARAEICPKCGVRQPWQAGMPGGGGVAGDAVTRTGKTKIVAALLAIFLGSFGVHKFYLGEIGRGILYLAFFWTAIPGIVGFIEGIIWLIQSNETWLAVHGNE